MKWSHLVAHDNRNSKWISPLYSTAIYPKCTYTLYSVSSAKPKFLSNIPLPCGMVFSISPPILQASGLYHHVWSTPSHCHLHLVCTNLAYDQPLEHKISTHGCHPISQNQTRAFNLPLFGNWWQPFTKIGFSIKFVNFHCLSKHLNQKIWFGQTIQVRFGSVGSPYICAILSLE